MPYGKTIFISEDSIKYTSYQTTNCKAGDIIEITIKLPTKFLAINLQVEEIKKDQQSSQIFGKIIWRNQKDCDDLSRAIYSVDWHREFLNRHAYFLTPSDFIASLFVQKSAPQYQDWEGFLYGEKQNLGIVANIKNKKNSVSLLSFEKLTPEEILTGTKMAKNYAQNVKIKIIEEESISSLATKGLDGARFWRYSGIISYETL